MQTEAKIFAAIATCFAAFLTAAASDTFAVQVAASIACSTALAAAVVTLLDGEAR